MGSTQCYRGNAVLALTGQFTFSPEIRGICRAAAATAGQFWKEEDQGL